MGSWLTCSKHHWLIFDRVEIENAAWSLRVESSIIDGQLVQIHLIDHLATLNSAPVTVPRHRMCVGTAIVVDTNVVGIGHLL